MVSAPRRDRSQARNFAFAGRFPAPVCSPPASIRNPFASIRRLIPHFARLLVAVYFLFAARGRGGAAGEWFIYAEPKVVYDADNGVYELRVKKTPCK
ncbi:MAG: hypothetical protein DBX55_07750 [Verrucomicrobia bacterium]|nr:MAG: hypothetical protein DBX55_07750 [Verrucomicrobiota bacterium]